MAKSNVTQYDTTAANNTDVGSISIAEGMAPSNVNNAIRELMAHTANWVSGSQAITKLTTTGEIELGHASDTTIARSSAGVVTIEGATVRTGTVAVANGGTGASTAAAAASALGVGTEDSPTFTNMTTTGNTIATGKALIGSGASGSIGGKLEVITGATGAIASFGGATGDELYVMNRAAGIVGLQTNSADTLESKSNTISFIDQSNTSIATLTASTATFAGDVKMSGASGSINFTDSSKGIYYDGNELVMFTTGTDDFITLNGETYVDFKVNSLPLMRLLPAGLHIGGTASPVSKLEITSATTVLPTVTVTADDQVTLAVQMPPNRRSR